MNSYCSEKNQSFFIKGKLPTSFCRSIIQKKCLFSGFLVFSCKTLFNFKFTVYWEKQHKILQSMVTVLNRDHLIFTQNETRKYKNEPKENVYPGTSITVSNTRDVCF